jgi:alpha-galactosidase
VTESTVRQIADAMVSDGLRAAGYRFVNVDDCWGAPHRNSVGKLVANPIRFPSGMRALGDYLHARQFGYGLYADAGTFTCNKLGFPGSLGHELLDARRFAQWGVDYLKYDNCNSNGVPATQRYGAMRNALDQVSRPIVYSISTWGRFAPWEWAPKISNLWRTSLDIRDSWTSMMAIVHANQGLAAFAAPGHWNDPDMLEVGNPYMTRTEQRTQMSLWAVMAAPLLISTDLRKADSFTLRTLSNPEVIAIDQDPLGKQATVVKSGNGITVYSKPLVNGDRAVALLNENATARTIRTTAAAVGLPATSSYRIVSVWSGHQSSSTGTISALVAPHGTVVFRVHTNYPPPPAGWSSVSGLTPLATMNGWGPIEIDTSNGERAQGDGHPLTIAGTTYKKGIGVHAFSRITYALHGSCTELVADVGVDDEVGNHGSVRFEVLADGNVIAKTGTLTGAGGAQHLDANLTGARQLTLVVTDAGDGIRYDHADWAQANIRCG